MEVRDTRGLRGRPRPTGAHWRDGDTRGLSCSPGHQALTGEAEVRDTRGLRRSPGHQALTGEVKVKGTLDALPALRRSQERWKKETLFRPSGAHRRALKQVKEQAKKPGAPRGPWNCLRSP